MKKSLIALAVAGTFAAPAAFAATANVDVYGRMNISIEDTNATNVDMAVVDRQSILGFKGAEDLGGGLKAIWQIETTLSGNQDGVGSTTVNYRNTFVGLSGGFGTALIGRHDTPYKLSTGRLDLFSDTIADYNGGGASNTKASKDGFTDLIQATHDHRSPSAIAYVSPNFSGFSFAAAVVATNTTNINSGDAFDAYSLSATYSNGPLFLTAGYQDVDALNSKALKLGAGYTFGDARIGFIYEDVENAGGVAGADRDSWIINGAYAMGPMTLKAQYGIVDRTGGADQSKLSLGLDYAMSKRTTAMVIYDTNKTKNNRVGSLNGWAVGVRHSF